MKCVARKTTDNREIVRISNEEAAARVATGKWHYIPKSTWKSAGRPGHGSIAFAKAE